MLAEEVDRPPDEHLDSDMWCYGIGGGETVRLRRGVLSQAAEKHACSCSTIQASSILNLLDGHALSMRHVVF
jgi:hypothetical protein